MVSPPPLACNAEGCDWTTPPNVPTWELITTLMGQHTQAAHPAGGQGSNGGGKQERLPRPALDTGITEADWTFFKAQWERYKRSTRLLGQDAIDQLWACASEELGRQCHDAGANKDTTEEELLVMFRRCSIRVGGALALPAE